MNPQTPNANDRKHWESVLALEEPKYSIEQIASRAQTSRQSTDKDRKESGGVTAQSRCIVRGQKTGSAFFVPARSSRPLAWHLHYADASRCSRPAGSAAKAWAAIGVASAFSRRVCCGISQ